MGWNNDEMNKVKKEGSVTSKILLAIICCIVLIILIIILILMSSAPSYIISVDGKEIKSISKEKLLLKKDNITYINIKELAKLVDYEYHEGEYKAYTIEKDKCYVQGPNETASFYLNNNSIYKLPVNLMNEDYREYITKNNTIKTDSGDMYASVDAICIAFNLKIEEQRDKLIIITLNFLVDWYEEKMVQWGYDSLIEQSFENKKAILYDCIIVRKKEGLYKIINVDNTKEIVSDKYKKIQFSENTKEFFVTNNLEQVGIINVDGSVKIEPVYETISILDKEADLYKIKKNNKYGVVKSGNVAIIFPEYDNVGYDNTTVPNPSDNQQLIFNELIPVSKNGIWGAFDKKGNKIIDLIYNCFGSSTTTITNGMNVKTVSPLLVIDKCKGIVVKKDESYGLIDITGKELIPITAECIYEIENEKNENRKYFMFYNKKEINIIEKLIAEGIIKDEQEPGTNENQNTITNNTIENTVTNNIINNNNAIANETNMNDVINNTTNNNMVDNSNNEFIVTL